ncbi:MAG: S26 family signal peptidase [Candidatus Poseidoniaceae archaeon]|nr:S26 family signal peptidase [Candidatus Poseidoniaceae archaeon]
MSDSDPLKTLLRELLLAAGMIGLLILALYAHTGSMPPLVVVESSSMIHDIDGEVGSIDAGDLVLVHNQDFDTIVTFAEATEPGNPKYGYSQHGLGGDVIIYKKNGEAGTPIIHRAIMEVVPNEISTPNRNVSSNASNSEHCPEGGTFDSESFDGDGILGVCVLTWDVPGTDVRDVETVTVHFDGIQAGFYDCNRPVHANVESHLVVWQWQPRHAGILTLGDNNNCSVDQGSQAVNGSSGVHSASGTVGPIRASWLIGVGGGEIPWLGTVKLMVSGEGTPGTSYVPSSSFLILFTLVGGVLVLPMLLEPVMRSFMSKAPEFEQAMSEHKKKKPELKTPEDASTWDAQNPKDSESE